MMKHTRGGVMKIKGSRRLVARLGLALAVAAVAVPSAQAMTMNAMNESGGSVRLFADDLHAAVVPAANRIQRQYADDLHASVVPTSLPASSVRTDAASVRVSLPASNVRTDAATVPVSVPVPGSNVRTDAATVPVSVPVPGSNVRTDAASFRGPSPITDDRHTALLRHNAQLGREPIQLASASPDSGIDWSVAGIGAALGAFGLMLLIGVVYFTTHHDRKGRLAAT
jgi:hypothetical protein